MKYNPNICYFKDKSLKERQLFVAEMTGFSIWFKRNFKLPIYLIYGTLIAACREHEFIKHDYDVDLAYLSKETDIDKIVVENEKILRKLKSMRLLVKEFGDGHNHIKLLGNKIVVDLWTSWFDKNDKFYCTGFYNGQLTKDDILPFTKQKLENKMFHVPKDFDKFLTVYYGNWKVPETKWKQTTQWIGLPKDEKN